MIFGRAIGILAITFSAVSSLAQTPRIALLEFFTEENSVRAEEAATN
jgi:hypothetical protein